MALPTTLPHSSWISPVVAIGFFGLLNHFDTAAAPTSALGIVFSILLIPILFAAVFAAVHHAEVIAHRTGEPFGTLILTLAVIVIEVALVASIMLSGDSRPALARDTVFAVVMLVCNGLVGLCLLLGGLRYREQNFQVSGVTVYLAVLLVLATLSMVLPNYVGTPGPNFTVTQLVFVSLITVALYGVFLYTQTVRHRDYFITMGGPEDHGHVPDNREALISLGLLLLSLVSVILLAKKFAVVVEAGTAAIGAPAALAGIVIALLVLLPEGMAAVQAARKDQLQKSLNLALGSSLATIGLTLPVVAAVSIFLGQPLVLGLEAKDSILLALTLVVSVLTFGTGQTNLLFGFIHLVLFGTYVLLTALP
jgi:Ca2+:H+ antiporter